MDLAEISEKEVFVRKADLVNYFESLTLNYRKILRKVYKIANLLYMLVS